MTLKKEGKCNEQTNQIGEYFQCFLLHTTETVMRGSNSFRQWVNRIFPEHWFTYSRNWIKAVCCFVNRFHFFIIDTFFGTIGGFLTKKGYIRLRKYIVTFLPKSEKGLRIEPKFFFWRRPDLNPGRTICPDSHFDQSPIVFKKLGSINWLEMNPGQIGLACSQRDWTTN